MSDNVIPFSATERAARQQERESELDAQDLADDMALLLRTVASQIENGVIPAEALFVGMMVDRQDHWDFPYFFKNLTKMEVLGMLQTFLRGI